MPDSTHSEGTSARHYVRLGTKGQFVIPVEMRKRLGLSPGQKLRLSIADGQLVVKPVPADLLDRLRGSLAGPGPSALEDLMREHREEVERDEADAARWRGKRETGLLAPADPRVTSA